MTGCCGEEDDLSVANRKAKNVRQNMVAVEESDAGDCGKIDVLGSLVFKEGIELCSMSMIVLDTTG